MPAHREILATATRGVYAASLDLGRMARRTPLFSGADLKAFYPLPLPRDSKSSTRDFGGGTQVSSTLPGA